VDQASAVVISDVRGRTVRSVSVSGTGAVDLTFAANGAYLVTLRNGRGTTTARIAMGR
jgi:hypothetical protein